MPPFDPPFSGSIKPPDVPPDPSGDEWRGEPGPPGTPGAPGAPGTPGPPGLTNVYVSDTAPASPADTTLWWNSTDGQLYIRYNDGNSTQWVNAANPGGTGSAVMAGVTKTDHSGVILLGNQVQSLMAANTARRGWSFQNKSTADMYFDDLGNNASPTSNSSVYLPPGAYYESEPNGASVAAVSLYGTITNAPYVAKEW